MGKLCPNADEYFAVAVCASRAFYLKKGAVINDMGQPNPNPHRGPGQHGHSDHHHAVDSPSPMNFLWGLVLALLTFLLIVICVLSIHWITKLSTPDTPPADMEDITPPGDDLPPADEPTAPEMSETSYGQSWSLDHPTATLTFVSNAAYADFENVVFTRGASSALNLVALSYGMKNIQPGDEIITSLLEHHSSHMPWFNVAQQKGAIIKYIVSY